MKVLERSCPFLTLKQQQQQQQNASFLLSQCPHHLSVPLHPSPVTHAKQSTGPRVKSRRARAWRAHTHSHTRKSSNTRVTAESHVPATTDSNKLYRLSSLFLQSVTQSAFPIRNVTASPPPPQLPQETPPPPTPPHRTCGWGSETGVERSQ